MTNRLSHGARTHALPVRGSGVAALIVLVLIVFPEVPFLDRVESPVGLLID
jgi:hypothetical protein